MEKELSDLIEISRFYGERPEYVIAGGGNTSWKNDQYLYIKASGVSLAGIDKNGFCILDRAKLEKMNDMKLSADQDEREEQVKNALLESRLNPDSGLRPSVETSLHNLFSYRYVVHTHPTLINGLLASRDAEKVTRELFGDEALFIPYSDPGFILFSAIREKILEYRKKIGRDPRLVLIQNHGIFVAAGTIREIRELYGYVENKIRIQVRTFPGNNSVEVSAAMTEIVPAVRMMLSQSGLKAARMFNHESVSPYLHDREAFSGISNPFTPDQIVYCLSEYLFVQNNGNKEELINEINEGINEFRKRKGVNPRVIFIRNEGVIVSEDSAAALDYLESLVIDFTRISSISDNFGGPHPMTPEQIGFIENWEVENYRKKISLGKKGGGRVENKVSVVTGAAQGFGSGIASILFEEGANIVIADLNEEKGIEFVQKLNSGTGKNRAYFVKVDVSDAASVEQMIKTTVIRFGGIDILISNAGIVRAGSLDEMTPATFDLMTRVNYNGYFYCAKYASAVMKIQYQYNPAVFMDIIQINSKSGLKGSNKNFAYAGGKFGGIGLTQSFALELMPFHIKVNAICPGNYLDGPLWSDPVNGLFVQYLKAGKITGAETVEDVKKHYVSKVPAGKGCLPADVARAIFYAIEQEYETGQAIPVTGGQEMLS
jgi:NAD(P)-dependent dehydrogenase (short-subunit alcohol dehydrogenase family)/rhamnose utilization protein RhaD (predicted bifunctional aldolase and dehydrogenase)